MAPGLGAPRAKGPAGARREANTAGIETQEKTDEHPKEGRKASLAEEEVANTQKARKMGAPELQQDVKELMPGGKEAPEEGPEPERRGE